MKRNRKAQATLILLLAITSMGFACTADQEQKTAQYTKDFFVALNGFITSEFDARDAGFIAPDQHRVIRDKVNQINEAALTAERALAAGTSATGSIDTITAVLTSLEQNDIPGITDEGVRNTLRVALASLRNALNIWKANNL